MSPHHMARPGGRSARVHEAVHAATHALTAELGRDALTVPAIAARAGVTPSTIYRRWGDLGKLLSDIAVEQLRPDTAPADHGSFDADLQAYAHALVDEMSSASGRAYIRDTLLGDPDGSNAGQCSVYAARQIDVLLERATDRGEHLPARETVMDMVVAPIFYRILFHPSGIDDDMAARLVKRTLTGYEINSE